MCSCDADPPAIWSGANRRARKTYRCEECHAPIAKGATYRYVTALHDGSWSTFRFCLACERLSAEFIRLDDEGCWSVGSLIESVFECDLLPELSPASAGHAAGAMFRWREKERDERAGRKAA